MGGFVTKSMIALTFFGLVTSFTLLAMAELGNEYGRAVESTYSSQFSNVDSELRAVQQESIEIEQGSTIDENSQDVAQLQGILSASKSQTDSKSIATTALLEIQDILPFDSIVYNALLGILTIVSFGALIYIFIGRWI